MLDSRISILCLDDHPLVREGIILKIDAQPDMKVVASAATGEEALELFWQHRPNVTLVDLQLPTISGLDVIREIRRREPEARIIVLTVYQGDEDIHRALQAGATTYLLKSTLPDDLIRVVREVHAGARHLPSDVAMQLAARASWTSLTAREMDVLERIAAGMRNKEIAAVLGISEETVEVHVRNMFGKLHVQDRTAAVAVALRRGIIHVH